MKILIFFLIRFKFWLLDRKKRLIYLLHSTTFKLSGHATDVWCRFTDSARNKLYYFNFEGGRFLTRIMYRYRKNVLFSDFFIISCVDSRRYQNITGRRIFEGKPKSKLYRAIFFSLVNNFFIKFDGIIIHIILSKYWYLN